MKDLEARIYQIIASQLAIELGTIQRDSRLVEDLGADSLDFVELTMAVEEHFDITIADEQAEQLSTVADLLNYVASLAPATV